MASIWGTIEKKYFKRTAEQLQVPRISVREFPGVTADQILGVYGRSDIHTKGLSGDS
jgi:hypothetical protein